VQAHGGSVAVDSEVGRGTKFTVRLPTAPAPMDADGRKGDSQRAWNQRDVCHWWHTATEAVAFVRAEIAHLRGLPS
jgi:hypothetical protein